MVLFSLFALMMAVRALRRQGVRLTHANLRRPFYGQCFTTAPFSLMIGIATLTRSLMSAAWRDAGLIVLLVALTWYLGVQSL